MAALRSRSPRAASRTRYTVDGRRGDPPFLAGFRSEPVGRGTLLDMSTLAVVEEVLREASEPLGPREIVARAGRRLPSKSRTPDTVVARDLSRDIRANGDGSRFARIARGRYVLRDRRL